MAAVTTIHLIRHPWYELLDRGILAGRMSGWGLDPTGRAQAAALAQVFAGQNLAAVVASPLERAQQTADTIAAPHGLSVETAPGLNEVDFGEWTGATFAALHEQPDWQAYNTFRSTTAPPGGETMLAVQLRALDVVAGLARRFPNAEVVAVSHADVIRALLTHALGMPLDLFRRIEIAPASRSLLALGRDFVQVLGVNLPLPPPQHEGAAVP